MSRSGSVAMVAMVSIGLLAGCSSGSDSSSSDTGSSASASASASASTKSDRPLAEYLLQASDVPTGYSQMTIPANQMSSATESLLTSTKNSKVSPAKCQPDLSTVSADSVSKSALAYFSSASTGDLIVSAAVPDAGYVANYRKYNLGSCAKHEVAGSINGQAFTGAVSTKTLDLATPGIDGSVVIQQDVASKLAGGANAPAQSSLLALLPVNGVAVLVTQKSIVGTKAPDENAFRAVLAAAVKRAANG